MAKLSTSSSSTTCSKSVQLSPDGAVDLSGSAFAALSTSLTHATPTGLQQLDGKQSSCIGAVACTKLVLCGIPAHVGRVYITPMPSSYCFVSLLSPVTAFFAPFAAFFVA